MMYEMRNLCSVHTDTATAVKCSAQMQPGKPTRVREREHYRKLATKKVLNTWQITRYVHMCWGLCCL